jgi:hypothetical protein
VKALLARLSLLAASLAFVALFLELVLRIVIGPPVIYRYPQESYVHDPLMGHRLAPGDRAFTHDEVVEINDEGLRGPDVSHAVPAGTRRVLALGDSETFGNGLALEETWPFLLETELAERYPDFDWQVLNAGISGTDTWQHAYLLERLARIYEFDAVVLAFYVNDVTKRYTPVRADQLSNTMSKRVGYVLKRSALFTLAWHTWQQNTSTGDAAEIEHKTLRGDPDPRIDEAWAQVEMSLRDMRDLCARLGVPFAIAVLPRRDQVSGDEPGRAYNTHLAEIAGRLGVPVTDLLAPLQSAYAREGDALFIPWDGHNTGVANEVIADWVAKHLDDIWLKGGASRR